MIPILIEDIPHKSQRYDTSGDYYEYMGFSFIKVSEELPEDMQFLIAVHELVEMYLTKKRGISEKKITAFDKKFEKKRKKGNVDEPGDDPKAPYQREHNFATGIERLLCAELGIKWADYEKAVLKLKY